MADCSGTVSIRFNAISASINADAKTVRFHREVDQELVVPWIDLLYLIEAANLAKSIIYTLTPPFTESAGPL